MLFINYSAPTDFNQANILNYAMWIWSGYGSNIIIISTKYFYHLLVLLLLLFNKSTFVNFLHQVYADHNIWLD